MLQDFKNLATLTEEEDFYFAKRLTLKKWQSIAP